eukprot:TRINITY_DN36965_c0_g1_i1.p1 TRINITY_DN36965_c0_g1~~TRINITY_DN36965_c0_g1_i1.p1  ORF type:complete len:305 (+),score=35.49 TRINITY_DN36965_c0_g1_i1:67-981(+)
MDLDLPARPHPFDETFFWMIVVGTLPASGIAANTATGACLFGGSGKGGWRMVTVVAALTLWQYWVFIGLWHYPRLSTHGLPAHVLVYHVFMALWLYCWVRGILADVTCPASTEQLKAARDAVESSNGKSAEAMDRLFAVKREHRNAGAHSCQTLGGAVVPGFDHFCPILNNAVGTRNRKYFLLALMYEVPAGLILLADGVPVAQRILSMKEWGLAHAQILSGTVLACHVNFAVAGLLVVQLASILLGTTSVGLWPYLPFSSAERADIRLRPFSVEYMKGVLGSRVLLWPFPVNVPEPKHCTKQD